MASYFEQVLNLPIHQQPTADGLLGQLVDAETEYRQQRRYETIYKAARFRYQASVAEVQCSTARNLDQALFLRLAEGSFISRGENVFITGATGCGKTGRPEPLRRFSIGPAGVPAGLPGGLL